MRGPVLDPETTGTVHYEISETPEGLVFKTRLFVGGEMIFDTHTDPAILADCTLSEFNRLALIITSAAKATGEEFIDLISLKLWQ